MGDNLAVIQTAQTLEELTKIIEKTKTLVTEFKSLQSVVTQINNLFKSGVPREYIDALNRMEENANKYEETSRRVAELQRTISNLERQLTQATRERSQATSQEQRLQERSNFLRTEEARRIAALRLETIELDRANRNRAESELRSMNILNQSIGMYRNVELRLNSLQSRYRDLAIRKQMGERLTDSEIRKMKNLEERIKKYDAALKGVDASMGRHQRNVGNYASGFNPLNNSINQITREMPAFANSVQTGFMAISNNIPIFFDAIAQIRRQNAIFRAEGQTTQSVFRQLAAGVLSWGTALSIGVTLLTFYGKDIVEFVKNMFNTKSAIDKVTESLEKNNDTMASTASRNIAEFDKLRRGWDSLSGSLKERKKYIDDNKNSFDNLGIAINSVSQAEKLFSSQSKDFIDILKIRAKAAAQYELAIESYKEASLNEGQGVSVSTAIKEGINTLSSQFGFDVFNRLSGDFKLESQKDLDLAEKRMDAFSRLEKEADDKQKKLGLGKPEKAVKDNSRKIMRDHLSDLEAIRDTQLAINERAFTRLEIDEETYLKTEYKINKTYFNAKINYLKGKTAEERKLRAQAQLELSKAEKKFNEDMFKLYSDRLDKQNNKAKDELSRVQKTAQNNEYISEEDRQKRLLSNIDDRIKTEEKYYDKLIQIAIETNKSLTEIADIEFKRDQSLLDLQDERYKIQKDLLKGVESDLKATLAIVENSRLLTQEEQKQALFNDKTLTFKQRQLAIERQSLSMNIEDLKASRESLILEQRRLEIKNKSGLISPEEKKMISDIGLELAKVNLSILQSEKGLRNWDIKQLYEKARPAVEIITKGFQDMGLSGIADEFTSVYQRILNEGEEFSMSAKDIFKSAMAVIGDFGNQFVETSKQKAIAALDEQLKHSQATTELEIGFLQGRINQLNALGELTQEQTEERNAMEDEARVLKEQQFQREKQIAAQKARAEQTAAAQTALINGGLAATKTLAEMGFITGIPFAAAALGFGALQAGLIMARNPVPQYYIGTENARKGLAWTNERGAEIHTDKHGNIKDFGDNKGARLTYMEAGDKVYTASQTKKILENIDEPNYKSLMFNKVGSPTFVNNNIDVDRIGVIVSKEFERVMSKYDKTNVYELNGKIIMEKGNDIPVIIGDAEPLTVTIKSNKVTRD